MGQTHSAPPQDALQFREMVRLTWLTQTAGGDVDDTNGMLVGPGSLPGRRCYAAPRLSMGAAFLAGP